jgi:Flp pilus assembly protein protease CpaA
LLVNLALRQGNGATLNLEGWLVGIGVLLLPFMARGVGGGDVKLLAAIGAWNGPGFVIQCLSWAALALLVIRGQLIGTLRTGLARVAYIVAMAIALLVPPLANVAQSRLGALTRGDGVAAGLRLAISFGPALAVGGLVALAVAHL